jgi:hypothetical protein
MKFDEISCGPINLCPHINYLMTTFCIGFLLLISPCPSGKPGRLQRRVFVSLQEVLPPSIQDGEAGRKKEGNGGQEGGEGRNSWEECDDFR